MPTFAVLLDGGFVKRKLGSPDSPFDAAAASRLCSWLKGHELLTEYRLHRIYFYDAKPLEGNKKRPLGGGPYSFTAHPTFALNKKLHEEIVRQPFVSLRMGELNFRGWSVSNQTLRGNGPVQVSHEDLSPNIQQKGVDMRIGLDIAALTLKAQVDVIVLVTGDSDFVPAMKFARREGAQLILFTLGHSVKEEMLEHADVVVSDIPDPTPAG